MPVPLYQAKADFFRTLGHPARIRILELLATGDKPVHELLSSIAIEPSNLSQQLAVLRMAGLVAQRRAGTEVIYTLALPDVRDLLVAARQILETKHAASDRLVDEVSRNHDVDDEPPTPEEGQADSASTSVSWRNPTQS